ncbi:sulfotransferase family protein [Novosphingobium mangrovi (ex Huang et al. 2023)]|uniref:Sulfotransferase n=1 Tax=Novosphingobium mangrovi (ex Huang et al. 2023) TaxID=2976432 RepID=A0ABT2I1V5_9SPHN|nr:sulfotransferase [Novosphingobium mangrovi (ex Huang et al. 2023)]MCT2398779.1 sulfotransferase [Novosphingobium mangrovi (ex Huang et al. 2023)]
MLDASAIIAEAEAKAGIADTDPGVAGNLERLVAAIGETFPLSEAGEARVRATFLMDATNRLESLKWLRDYPEIGDEPIEAPVFLMGLPRSGTTYFQYLFDRDPRFRLIRTWESTMPSPPPGFDPASIEVRRAAWRELQKARPHFEGFEALHLYDEDGSDECHAFLQQSWGAAGLHNLFRVPQYFDWLLDELDLVETYKVHKRQLQCLQWRNDRKPWALKYPNHIVAMNEILEVYPDARFVMTHRDPAQVVASISKMTWNLRSMYAASPVEREEVGRDMLHFIQRHIDRIMAFDAGPHTDRVVHVDYYALVADPVGEMRRIHAGIGIETPDAVAKAVGDWHANNPKNARGRNDYSLGQYGLDPDALREQFAPYVARFAIPAEAEGLGRIGAPT